MVEKADREIKGDVEAHPVWQPTGDAEHENAKCVVVRDNHLLQMLRAFVFWMKSSRVSLVLIWKTTESSVGVEKGKSERIWPFQ